MRLPRSLGPSLSLSMTLLAASMLPLCTAGCVVEHDHGPPVVVATSGTMILDWTIENAKIPAECSRFGAVTLQVSIRTRGGLDAGTYTQSCEAFATSIVLPADDYDANALLLDAAGNARTTVVAIQPFSIFGNDQLTIPIDFPLDSFY